MLVIFCSWLQLSAVFSATVVIHLQKRVSMTWLWPPNRQDIIFCSCGFFFLLLSLGYSERSLNGGQPNFARCLVVSWTVTDYMYTFWGLLPPNGILPGAKFTLRPSLAFFYIGSVAAQHSSSGRQPNFAAWFLHATRRISHSTFGGRTV